MEEYEGLVGDESDNFLDEALAVQYISERVYQTLKPWIGKPATKELHEQLHQTLMALVEEDIIEPRQDN